ncbi:hypothetical protein LOD99_8260 [Oopsacas minuta]|uniref:EGF-like domain-containing protein n=1 Tax=Oopsacas minuta TaxID=111878 RepID=A0AAV7JGQ9_9METZ|nr:hypothetical protein LOD99_8260 [Oopsacas minuta]
MSFFSQNAFIQKIEVDNSLVVQESSRVIDQTVVGSLDNLERFYWESGRITKLMPDSFIGTYILEKLSLYDNNLQELGDCTFDDLYNLYSINLAGNNITKVGEYTFIGVDILQRAYLDDNPSFPLSALTLANTIVKLDVDHYNPALLKPEIFQQFLYLSYLSLKYISFNCTCETEWISTLCGHKISVNLDSFNYCPGNPGIQVDDPNLYVNCNNTNPSYQCFDHSIVCPGDNTWYRVDTEDSCNCTYPPERAFYNDSSFVCSDIDECEDSSICENSNCMNIIGSYTCDCNEGYFNLNETFCNDVNECGANNGGCEQNCTNTNGSFIDIDECEVNNGGCDQNCTNAIGKYECTCFEGYSMQGLLCADTNECEESNGNCLHNCNNSIESFECSCFDGFVISSTNSSDCESITAGFRILNLGGTESILVTLAIIFLILIIFFVGIILVILFCLYARSQSRKPVPKPVVTTTKPTIAELDRMKSIIIQNPLSGLEGFSLEPLKDPKSVPDVGVDTLTPN